MVDLPDLPAGTVHLQYRYAFAPSDDEAFLKESDGVAAVAAQRRASKKRASSKEPLVRELYVTVADANGRDLRLQRLPKAEVFDWSCSNEVVNYMLACFRRELRIGLRVLELGCGMGIPSLVCAALGSEAVCTDLESALGPLRRNAALNHFPQIVWEVVGGARVGGIIVQEEMGIGDLPDRLQPGALVEQLAREGNYIQYTKLRGNGPQVGWIKYKRYGCDPDVVLSDERPQMDDTGGVLRTVEFKWETGDPKELLQNGNFDIVICSDCVYEPAYGQRSLQKLPGVLEAVCGPNTTIILSVVRRFADGFDVFMNRLKELPLLIEPLPTSPAASEKTKLFTLRKETQSEKFYKKMNDRNTDSGEDSSQDDEPDFLRAARGRGR